MRKTFGFIGTGNMGSALARAVAKTVDPVSIILSNRTMDKAKQHLRIQLSEFDEKGDAAHD